MIKSNLPEKKIPEDDKRRTFEETLKTLEEKVGHHVEGKGDAERDGEEKEKDGFQVDINVRSSPSLGRFVLADQKIEVMHFSLRH